jgi:hypothetical protein
VVMWGKGVSIMYRTCFGDGDCKVGEGDKAHWRSYYQRSLDPWVIMFESLDRIHGASLSCLVEL